MTEDLIRASIVGATGYTGAELLRLLVGHPRVQVSSVSGRANAGKRLAEVVPSMQGILDIPVDKFDADTIASNSDVAFCALPHATSAEVVDALRATGLPVLDLSADFRLKDLDTYAKWYGMHSAPARIREASYGMVELHREALREADLIAVPGCYPTAVVLGLAPLVEQGLIDPEGIVVDAKSGVSGAGRAAKPSTHLPESAEGVRAYKAGAHRHAPEIEQELSRLAGKPVEITFVPHMVPMTRGILATMYATPRKGTTASTCTDAARKLYASSPSVVVLDEDAHPDTLWVRGSNRAHLAYRQDPRTKKIIVMSTIDNLVKGAAGQAVQAFNVRFGFPEGLGLEAPAQWP